MGITRYFWNRMDQENFVVFFADGGSRGNPGPAAWGSVVYKLSELAQWLNFDPTNYDARKYEEFVFQELSQYSGETTNNIAEWSGVVETLEYLDRELDLKNTKLKICLDSQLVVRQLSGQYKVKNQGLIPLFKKAKVILDKTQKWEAIHIYREYNKLADSLVNQVLDSQINHQLFKS